MKSKKISEAGSYSRGFAGTGGRREREDDEGYARTRSADDAHNRAISRPKAASVAEPAGQFFIRIDGKVWRKNGEPVTFDTKEHAIAVGRKIREKIPGRTIMLTTNPADKVLSQGMGEEAVGTIVPSSKPGEVSVQDTTTKVTTSLPANSPMLGKDAEGKLVLHTQPTTGGTPSGQPPKPELPKPGEKVQIASEDNENESPGYVKYEQMKDKIGSVLSKLYHKGHDAEKFSEMGGRVAAHLGYDPTDKIYNQAWRNALTDYHIDSNFGDDQDDDDEDYTDYTMRQGEMGRRGSNEAVNRISAGGHTPGDELADTNVESPISGDEAEGNLISRMRKLAGLKESIGLKETADKAAVTALQDAIKRFQTMAGIKVDGQVGPETRVAIQTAMKVPTGAAVPGALASAPAVAPPAYTISKNTAAPVAGPPIKSAGASPAVSGQRTSTQSAPQNNIATTNASTTLRGFDVNAARQTPEYQTILKQAERAGKGPGAYQAADMQYKAGIAKGTIKQPTGVRPALDDDDF